MSALAMDITALLRRVQTGDREALDQVVPLVYDELKKLASAHLRRDRHATGLDTTGLVHEAFLRLAGTRHPDYENRSHFYGIASRLMRQILVQMARARKAEKRGAGNELHLADIPDFGQQSAGSLLAIHEALERLGQTDPLKVQLIEMRFFGGMTAEESAEVLSMPLQTVRRKLRVAQAWLRQELAR
jgi:RNA polymerase sigma factor (TIGR02999 family)